MSRLWAEDWRIGLAPEGCELLRIDWRGRTVQTWARPCEPPPGQPAWQAALESLPPLLEEAGAGGGGAAVVLSNHFVRYLVLPWQPEVNGERELLELARMRFQAVYGEGSAGWTLRCSQGGWGQTVVACAVDAELVAALTAALGTRGLRLVALQPLLMAAFNDMRRRLAGDAAFAVLEPGRVCLGLMQDGAFEAIVSRRAPADAALAVEQELATLRPLAGDQPLDLLRVGDAPAWPADGARQVHERPGRPLAAWGTA